MCVFIGLHHLFMYYCYHIFMMIHVVRYFSSVCFVFKCASDLISVMYVSISKLFNIPLFYVFLCGYEKKKTSEEMVSRLTIRQMI